jgi:hypothetical protein
MELGGDEKRIQALFSELSLEDQSSVPQFGRLWMRAHVMKDSNTGGLGTPIAVLISVLVTAAACSLAIWTWYRITPASGPNIVNQLPQGTIAETRPIVNPVKLVPVARPERVHLPHHKTIARQRQADRTLTTEATLLSSWQSPTQSFMTSPTGLVLSTLPQLNQSVKDLESFLPKKNEIMKESNQ